MLCERPPWKHVGWVPLQNTGAFFGLFKLHWVYCRFSARLGFTTACFGSSFKNSLKGNYVNFMQYATKQMQWPAVTCTEICSPPWFHLLCSMWCSMCLGLNWDFLWPLNHCCGEGLPPIGKEKYNSGTSSIYIRFLLLISGWRLAEAEPGSPRSGLLQEHAF